MTIYRGVNGVNREIKQQFRGVGGVNREIKEQYRGVGGVNRKVFENKPTGALYWAGDECLDKTGGWKNCHPYNRELAKNQDNMEKTIEPTKTDNITYWQGTLTANKVSTRGFSKLKILTQTYEVAYHGHRYLFGLSDTNSTSTSGWDSFARSTGYIEVSSPEVVELELDISSMQGDYYIKVEVEPRSKLYKIWLE